MYIYYSILCVILSIAMELAKDQPSYSSKVCPSYYLSKGNRNMSENFGSYGDDIAQIGGSLLRFEQDGRLGQSPFLRNVQRNENDEYLIHTHTAANASSCSYASSSTNEFPFGWLIGNEYGNVNAIRDVDRQESCMSKRPYGGESMQPTKKHCKSTTKMQKSKGKGPQSVAAKNRRERISERMKVLQDLVPNGSKVDLVTMLEKAISYVKFLQLQVKVLATDEFWPAQGGKAPDISQVKEAIDAILASQRDNNNINNNNYSSST